LELLWHLSGHLLTWTLKAKTTSLNTLHLQSLLQNKGIQVEILIAVMIASSAVFGTIGIYAFFELA